LDSKTARTSFGKLPLSDEKSQPVFGFTQAKRDESEKLYLGEITKTNNMAKQSPGPVYIYQDNIKYEQVFSYYKRTSIVFQSVYKTFEIETSLGIRYS
jgi:hypothetical protein